MNGYGYAGAGWWLLLAIFVATVVMLIWVVWSSRGNRLREGMTSSHAVPIDQEIQRRYARGEIDEATYQRLMDALQHRRAA